jgi:putative methylase
MQKRLARKLDLEMLLSSVKPHPKPSTSLEQYTVSADVAAQMLYMAAYTYEDIVNKTVLDLGCGTGRLALGAAYLGAKQVVGVDIDRAAVKAALENSTNLGLQDKVQWLAADIDAVSGKFDTVLQNPPFGVQKRGADRRFLEKALTSGQAVYSLHKNVQTSTALNRGLKAHRKDTVQASSSRFLSRLIEKHGGHIKAVYPMTMTIPHMFSFHTEKKHKFTVDLYIIERKET